MHDTEGDNTCNSYFPKPGPVFCNDVLTLYALGQWSERQSTHVNNRIKYNITTKISALAISKAKLSKDASNIDLVKV